MLPFHDILWNELQSVYSTIEAELNLRTGSVLNLETIRQENADFSIRPALLLAIARAYGYEKEKALGVAVVIQFIYLATLVHSEVGDELKDTEQPNIQLPILVGDFLYSQFFRYLGLYNVLEYLTPLSRVVCEIHEAGVLKRMLTSGDCPNSEIIGKEFGSLTSAACLIGAKLAGASQDDQELLGRFGHQLGMAMGLQKYHYDSHRTIAAYEKAKENLGGLRIQLPALHKICDYLADLNILDTIM